MATAQTLGIAIHGVQLGVQSVLFRPARRIGDFVAQVTLEETHVDELEITDHPVEQGAKISDHSYMRPSEITIRCGWSDSPSIGGFVAGLGSVVTGTQAGIGAIISGNGISQSRDVYAKLLKLQTAREPISVVTGKRSYDNMLVKSLRVETNKETENSLIVTAVLRQVIVVTTQVLVIATPKDAQALADLTAAPINQGLKQLLPAPNYNAGSGSLAINPGGQ